ncbi:hypothetical protein [Fulvivirga marina]|nr:hypothetical protein [Fulvivirga marina]
MKLVYIKDADTGFFRALQHGTKELLKAEHKITDIIVVTKFT